MIQAVVLYLSADSIFAELLIELSSMSLKWGSVNIDNVCSSPKSIFPFNVVFFKRNNTFSFIYIIFLLLLFLVGLWWMVIRKRLICKCTDSKSLPLRFPLLGLSEIDCHTFASSFHCRKLRPSKRSVPCQKNFFWLQPSSEQPFLWESRT